jgi:ribose transport system ATP-binding protein
VTDHIIEARNITKTFGGVVALHKAEFLCPAGKVVGLLGENGSGKTTLSRILTGYYPKTSGEIRYKGAPINFTSPHEASHHGIGMVHQNFSLVPDLTVWENIFLGKEPLRVMKMLDNKKIKADTRLHLDTLCPWIDINTKVSTLLPSEQQLVEIVKALSRQPSFLILDEPTSALERKQVKTLFGLMNALKNTGVSMVFISHRMHEVEEICDYVVVLRNGETAGTVDLQDKTAVNYDEIVSLITGARAVKTQQKSITKRQPGSVLLKAVAIGDGDKIHAVSFQIKKGEIVGLAGLQGQGQEELVLSLAGFQKIQSGHLVLNDHTCAFKNPGQAIEAGFVLVPGNRQTDGLFMDLPIFHNITFPWNTRPASSWILPYKKLMQSSSELVAEFSLKTDSLSNPVSALSGGNAQKVVVAKWLPLSPKLLLLSDAAKGIDVQAKSDLHQLIMSLAEKGTAILLYASDLNELIHICDRILIMYEGTIVDEVINAGIDDEFLMSKCIQHGRSDVQQSAEGRRAT